MGPVRNAWCDLLGIGIHEGRRLHLSTKGAFRSSRRGGTELGARRRGAAYLLGITLKLAHFWAVDPMGPQGAVAAGERSRIEKSPFGASQKRGSPKKNPPGIVCTADPLGSWTRLHS